MKNKIEEMIRVDHAGERGAIKIYDGQLLALQFLKGDPDLEKKVAEMKEHEKEHLKYFEQQLADRKIRPTLLLPLWDLLFYPKPPYQIQAQFQANPIEGAVEWV